MAALFSLASLLPAQAQQPTTHCWNITYASTFTTTYAIPDSPAPGQTTPESSPFGGSESETYINANESGTITATLTWVPTPGPVADPPPKTVFIQEFGQAEESPANWNGPGSAPTPAGSASDGLGDPPVPWCSGYISTGSHLVQRDGSSGTITLGPFSVSAVNPTSNWLTSSNGGGYPGGGYPGGPTGGGHYWDWTGGLCEASVGVSVVSKGLAITSFSTKHKDTITGNAVPDVPDPDGTFEMTSIYSHDDWTTGGEVPVDVPFINWIGFTPNYIGNWHWLSGIDHKNNVVTAPDVIFPDTWVWSPNESEDDWDYGKVSMGYGQISYQDGEPYGNLTGNQTYHVSLSATDNTDSVTATAHANIALHDEWENKQNASPATTLNSKRTYAMVAGTAVGVSNNTATKFTSPPTWTATINGSATLGIKFGSTFDVAWAKMFGIEVNGAATVGGSIAISVPGPLLNPGFWTFPFVLTTWNTNNYLVDHYTVTGFEATYPQSADDPNSVTETGSWSDPQLIGQSPPP